MQSNPFTRDGRTLHYHGEAVVLAGTYPRQADGSSIEHLPDVDYGPIMRDMAAHRNNFTRFWCFSYWLYAQAGYAYSPFTRATKWKVPQTAAGPWNESWFDRLERMIVAAQGYGVVVQVTLFDTPGLKSMPGRWEDNPWKAENSNLSALVGLTEALPEFYDIWNDDTPITSSDSTATKRRKRLRAAQKAFVAKVVGRTSKYWNVTYEIVNEMLGGNTGDSTEVNRERRVSWLDAVHGWIEAASDGARLTFHCDYADSKQGGGDLTWWRTHKATFPEWNNLDGAIFHGNPNTVDPASYPFATEKVFQASSDAFDATKRESQAWNQSTASALAARGIVFQAEALSTAAATGIQLATPSPTNLSLAPFAYLYRKTSTTGPIFDLRIFVAENLASGVASPSHGYFFTWDRTTRVENGRGRVAEVAYTDAGVARLRLQNLTTGNDLWWQAVLDPTTHALTLTRESDGYVQTFARVARAGAVAVAPLLYNWRRIQTSAGDTTHFDLRFDIDGGSHAYRTTGLFDHREIQSVDAANKAFTVYSYVNDSTVSWTWSFPTVAAGATRQLKLVRSDGFWQLFEELPGYVPTI